MAVTNFQQTVWSKKIQDALELATKLVGNCTREYEGDCVLANTVKILGVGDPTIGKYDGTDITIEAMTDASQSLNIDQANYFAFEVKDVDKAQSVPGLPEKYQAKAVHGLAVKRDNYVANLIKAGTNITLATSRTSEAIKTNIDLGIISFLERNNDQAGVIELDPYTYKMFKNELTELSTNNPEMIKKGYVGMYDNFEVYMSNGLAKDDNYVYCDIRSKEAIAFAGQINEVEAGRMEKRFSDYIRGLDTFGSKIIANDEMEVVKFPLVEPTA